MKLKILVLAVSLSSLLSPNTYGETLNRDNLIKISTKLSDKTELFKDRSMDGLSTMDITFPCVVQVSLNWAESMGNLSAQFDQELVREFGTIKDTQSDDLEVYSSKSPKNRDIAEKIARHMTGEGRDKFTGGSSVKASELNSGNYRNLELEFQYCFSPQFIQEMSK